MRFLNMFLMILLTASLLLGGDQLTRKIDTSPGKRLEVDLNTGGSIEVIGWDKDVVSVNARTHGGDIENRTHCRRDDPDGPDKNEVRNHGFRASFLQLSLILSQGCHPERNNDQCGDEKKDDRSFQAFTHYSLLYWQISGDL